MFEILGLKINVSSYHIEEIVIDILHTTMRSMHNGIDS
jgi:hypothetical protein